jgi:hypothetical protein
MSKRLKLAKQNGVDQLARERRNSQLARDSNSPNMKEYVKLLLTTWGNLTISLIATTLVPLSIKTVNTDKRAHLIFFLLEE